MSAPSMPCTEVRQRLTPFLDGELEGEECWSMRRHLDACPPCGQAAEVERNFKKVLRAGLRCETAPSALASRLRGALASAEAQGSLARWPFWPVGLAAAGYAMAGAFLALWLAGVGRTPQAPVRSERTPAAGSAAQALEALSLVPVHLRGTIVCATCGQMQAPLEQQIACAGSGHLNGVRDEQGRLWHLYPALRASPQPGEAGQLKDSGRRGRVVLVDGQVVEELSYLIPGRVQFL